MTQSGSETAREVRRVLDRYDPTIVRLVNAARRHLRKPHPPATGLGHDNYNALVFGYGPSERASEAVFSVAAYPRWVNLFFLHGAHLPDPGGLLQGAGRQVRSIRLVSAAMLDDPAVQDLLRSAVARMSVPFGTGRGRTVIRALARLRRARRPAPPVRPRRAP